MNKRSSGKSTSGKSHSFYGTIISEEEFQLIVSKVGAGIRRLVALHAEATSVYGTVESLSTLSNWSFRIDFNDIDDYKIVCDVNNSNIPEAIAKRVNDIIKKIVNGELEYEAGRKTNTESYKDPFEDPEFVANMNRLHAEAEKNRTEIELKKAEAECIRLENERIENERRAARKRRTIKCISILIIVFLLLGTICGIYIKIKQRIPVTFSSEEIVGHNIDDVTMKLEEAGFIAVYSEPMGDLSAKEADKENTVESIRFGNEDSFNADTKYPYNIEVTVSYHTFKSIYAPTDNKTVKKKNYEDVVKEFKDAGFENIETEAAYDLTELLGKNKNNTIKKIYINDSDDFESGAMYSADCKVKIVYHTYRKDK